MFSILHLLLNFTLLLSLVISPAREQVSTKETGEGLPFTTIKIAQGGGAFPWYAPGLYMVWNEREIDKIASWVGSDVVDKLHEVDFDQEAVVAVFHGFCGDGGSAVKIVRYDLRNSTIVLHAQFWRVGPELTVPTVETSPYHIITIKKGAMLSASSNVEMHSARIIYHEDAGMEWPLTASLAADTD